MLKHVGKMKNNGAKVVVAYRTLPGDHKNALVIGTGNLGDDYHDDLMAVLQSAEGQQAYELAETLSVRKFRDGNNMLQWFHSRGHLKKVPTEGVLMTPTVQSSVSLDELNELIAKDKGITVEELALTDGKGKVVEKKSENLQTVSESKENMSASEMRSKADSLFKEAQALRKKADELDPPKKKTKKVVAEGQ